MSEVPYLLLGGFFGAATRFLLQALFDKLWPTKSIPMSILLINLIGCFCMGIIFPSKAQWDLSMQMMVSVGFLGAFTTYSTFSMEALELMKKHRYVDCFIYIAASLLGCILAFWVGHSCGATL